MNSGPSNTSRRPSFAVEPGPGQESVWDYPRPPAIARDHRTIEVRDGDRLIARSNGSYKVMETASPPTFYLPRDDIGMEWLAKVADRTYCESKGTATYWALERNPDLPVAWSYERPRARFSMIANYLAFYPGRLDCYVDGEPVQAQAGRFYGGWITPEVIGPFKGDPGTGHW